MKWVSIDYKIRCKVIVLLHILVERWRVTCCSAGSCTVWAPCGLWVFYFSQLSSLSLLAGDIAVFCIWLQESIISTRNLGWCFCVVGVWFIFVFFFQNKWSERNCKNGSTLLSSLLTSSSNSKQNHMSFVGMAKKCDRHVYCDFSSSASSQVLLWAIFRPFLWLSAYVSRCWGLIFSLLNRRGIYFFLVWMFLNVFFQIRFDMQK